MAPFQRRPWRPLNLLRPTISRRLVFAEDETNTPARRTGPAMNKEKLMQAESIIPDGPTFDDNPDQQPSTGSGGGKTDGTRSTVVKPKPTPKPKPKS
jgi:hypothetical protein